MLVEPCPWHGAYSSQVTEAQGGHGLRPVDPSLQPPCPACRPALSRTLAAFGAQWRQQPAFTATLLGNLLADMGRLADKAAAETAEAPGEPSAAAAGSAGGASLRQLLALAACVLPMLDAATAMQLPTCCSHLHQFLHVCRHAAAAGAAGAVSPAAASSAVAELVGHVSRLAALAPAAATATTLGSSGSSSSTPPGQPPHALLPATTTNPDAAGEYVAVQLSTSMQALTLSSGEHQGAGSEHVQLRLAIQPGATAGGEGSAAVSQSAAADSLLQLFGAVAAFAEAALSNVSILAHTATVISTLAAVRAWLQMLVQQQQQPGSLGVPLDATATMLLPRSASSPTAVSAGSDCWLLSLLGYGSKDVVLQVAQLLALLLPHSPAALGAVLSAIQAAGLAAGAAEESARSSQEAASLPAAGWGAEGADAAALLLSNFRLLEAVLPELPAAGLETVWQHLLPLAAEGLLGPGGRQQASLLQAQQQFLRLLLATGQRLVDDCQQFKVAADALAALARVLSSTSLPETILLATLQWLAQAAGWLAHQEAAAASVGAGSPAGSNSISAVLSAALACTDAPSAAVRTAALGAARALVSSSQGAALVLADTEAAGQLYRCALLHLSDVQSEAAAAAQQLLEAAAAPLVLASAAGAASTGSRGGTSAAARAATEAALGPQHLGFRPPQLQQLLGFLSSPDAPSALLTAAGPQQAAPLRHWLPRLLHTTRAVPVPAEERSARSPEDRPW